MPTPSLSTTYILAVVSTLVGLAVSQSLISNATAQLVTGIAATIVPAALAIAHSLVHARVQAAHVQAGNVAPAPSGVKAVTKTVAKP